MATNIVKQHYACFLHPQERGDSLEQACSKCGLPFGFPLDNRPVTINGRKVEAPLSRGFYGAVYRAAHSTISERKTAIKVIPVATYASHIMGGYGKSFAEEVRLHSDLSEINLVARLLDAGESELEFGTYRLPCYWMEMEYVRGDTLKELIASGPKNPPEIAQIASDLLQLVEELEQRHKRHNDLHTENIKVVRLEGGRERASGIARGVQTKVLDLGSVAEVSRSGPTRWGDVHQVANHILELVAAYERSQRDIEPGAHRICARLRQIAQYWCGNDNNKERSARARDLRLQIQSTCRSAEEWWKESTELDAISADINAVAMFSPRAKSLFCGPRRWKKELLESGTKILTGMRGCGKTMLLRSVHWEARSYKYPNEDAATVQKRLRDDRCLGLFVSCAALLRGPRPTENPKLVMHRLFLAFALEMVRFVQTCQLLRMGEINETGGELLGQLCARLAPWFRPPANARDLFELERAILTACNDIHEDWETLSSLNPRQAFDDFTEIVRSWVDLLKNKRFLFLLDDVSVRYLSADSVERILSQLCFQSSKFSFKISTESQTLDLRTPGDRVAQLGRDYETFDLGEEVFSILRKSSARVKFIDEILEKRARHTQGLARHLRRSPKELLGTQPLTELAEQIRSVKGRKKSSSDAAPQGKNVKVVYYWGIDALAAICVGDLGDVIEVYDRILSHAQSPGVIAHGAQQKELTDFAEGRLRDLAVRDPWLYAHAIAFAEASHGELKASGPLRLRQYAEVSVTIDVEHAKELFPLIVKLIDHGVFVVTGATARTKHRHSASHLEFKLAYRKLLGLTNRIPLSMRDRFELTGPKLEQWLRAPTSQMLRSAKKTTIRRPAEEKEAENRSLEQGRSVLEKSRRASLNVLTPTLFDPIQTDSELSSLPQKRMPIPEVLYEVETLQNVDVSDAKLDWGRTWVVAAAGFEDRSVGTWSNLLRVGRPAGVVLLSYPDPKNINRDNQQKIVEMLDAAGVMHCSLDTDGVPHPNIARRVKSLAKGDIVVDTTSLTKPLIFMLVRDLLVEDNRVRVLHTCAEQYLPTSRQLKPVVELLDGKKYRAAFDLLDERVSGEKGPYVPTWVDKLYFDPSRPVFLAISISLKHGPISAILDQGPVENIAVLFPLHSGRTRASRSLIARHLAEYLAEVYRGEAIPVASLDYETAYRRFVTLHERYSLQSAMNFEIGLAGPKLHTVGAAMFAATATPAGVYYSRPDTFDKTAFTRGTAHTSFIELCRVERRDARV